MARKKNVTFNDIAQYTHFSKTTISRYFNNPDSLAPESQRIISEALVKLDYKENKVARILANGQTEFIGIIVPEFYHRFFSEVLNQILSTYEIEVDKIHYNADREAELYIGNLVAQLGGNSDMNGKISELSDILRDYPDLNGTLFLDPYDENNTNPMYRFQQNPET